MTQHDEAFLVGEAVRLAEKYAGDTRSRENKDSFWLVCEFTEEQLAALIADVRRQAMEEYEDLEFRYHSLASEMVYEGNSVQHWQQKARAYKECAGVISDLKTLLGVDSPADVLSAIRARLEEGE